jgi:hypothetical protein
MRRAAASAIPLSQPKRTGIYTLDNHRQKVLSLSAIQFFNKVINLNPSDTMTMRKATLPLKILFICGVIAAMPAFVFAQTAATLTDVGTAAPTPGANDIYCTNTAGNTHWPNGNGGINYYSNNGTPPGQTFSNAPSAKVLTTLAIRTGGGDYGVYPGGSTPGGLGPQQWLLYIFSLSGNTATLLTSYESQSFQINADGDWIQWSGISVPLSANSAYAYAFAHAPGDNNWDALAVCSNSPSFYPGGEICLIPPAGGGVTYNTVGHDLYDANFVIGLVTPTLPVANPITVSPTNVIYAGSSVTLTEIGAGSPPITYQWQTDAGQTGSYTNIPSATNSTLTTVPPFTGSDIDYQCMVFNGVHESTTSPSTNVTVLAASGPLIIQDTTPSTAYAYVGGNPIFSVVFNGTTPISYQWQANTGGGYTNIPNATNATLNLTNVQLSDSGSYQVVATNSVSSQTSTPATLTVSADLAAPTATQKYPYAIYTDNPTAYWRFEETNLANSGNVSVEAYDYSGHDFMATYGSNAVNFDYNGPVPPVFPGFDANNLCVYLVNDGVTVDSFLYAPPINLNTNTVTITAWINPAANVPAYCGLFFNRNGNDAAGFGFGGNLNSLGTAELGYNWSNSPTAYNFHSGLYPPVNVWSFATLTITPTNASIYLMFETNDVNNQPVVNIYKAVNNAMTNQVESFTNGTSWIGSDNYTDTRDFPGFLDEVAVFNRSLNDAQVQNLFLTALGLSTPPAPVIVTEPTNAITILAGQSVTLTGLATGGLPLVYQWQLGATNTGTFTNLTDGGSGHISGSTSSTLIVSNAIAGYYRFVVTNTSPSGSVTSSNALVTVIPVPTGQWVANYCVSNSIGGYGLYNGPGVLGTGTFWNPIVNTNDEFAPNITISSSSSKQDNGVTDTGIGVTVTSVGGTYAFVSSGPLVFSQYVIAGSGSNSIVFTNMPNGVYNLCFFGIDGDRANQSGDFVINGVTNGLVNVQDRVFTLGDNCVLFTNIVVTNNTLEADEFATDTGEGDFNGVQLQYVSSGAVSGVLLSIQWSGSNLMLTWPTPADTTPILLQATNVQGPYTPVSGAMSPYTVPLTAAQRFYRLQVQ